MDWLCGNNSSGKQYTPYWGEEYGKCYFRPRIAGKGTTQHFISFLGIQSKADCKHIRKELKRLGEQPRPLIPSCCVLFSFFT